MAQIPHAYEGRICPLMKQDMSVVCHKCPLWVLVRGKNPQTNEEIDRWDCSLALMPMLLIEGAQQTRQAGAAIESFRNEMVEANRTGLALALMAQTHTPHMKEIDHVR